MSRIVIALGGNALGNSCQEQLKRAKETASAIVSAIQMGYEVIITHGNGPQVGLIQLAFEEHYQKNNLTMGLPECGAMSQGYIGFHLQNALKESLREVNLTMPVATIVTQVVVDQEDPAFLSPSKPIGTFYTELEAKHLIETKGYIMKEDAGRGYRRVVASPKPIGIVEIETIKALLQTNHVVITVGGGGIPVIEEGISYTGVDAVIDKDYASSKLADLLDADILCILTAVDHVLIGFNTTSAQELSQLTVDEALLHIKNNQFAKGSMLPKIEAAIEFVKNQPKRKAIIASLHKLTEALAGQSGTKITA
jgi:carbamate kinase